MAPSPDDFPGTSVPVSSPRARDRGLRRGRRLTRWITVTSVAGAAALGGFYTHLLPGGPAAPAPSGPSAPNPAASSTTAGGDDEEHGERSGHEAEDDEGAARVTRQTPRPQPPPQPPTATKQQPHTTTGAS